MATESFEIVYDDVVRGHLGAIDKKYHTLIEKTLEEQLRHEPESPTRNRKPLRQPAALDATWELRLGPDNRFPRFLSRRGAAGARPGDWRQKASAPQGRRQGGPAMKTASVSALRAPLSAYLKPTDPVLGTQQGR